MCGIAGFICRAGLEKADAHRLARALLYYASVRGDHSAGAFVDGMVAKRAIKPFDFGVSDEFDSLFPNDAVNLCMVHTRHPTSGGRGDDHAQPFVVGNVAACHNGSIVNEKELREEFGIENASGVDSELFAAFLAKHGPGKLTAMFDAMYGSAAVAAAIDGRLYLARTSNPIYTVRITVNGSKSLFAYASTGAILMDALRFAWLVPGSITPCALEAGQCYRVKDSDLAAVGPALKPKFKERFKGTRFNDDLDDLSGYGRIHTPKPVRDRGTIYRVEKITGPERTNLIRVGVAIAAANGLTLENPSDYGCIFVGTSERRWLTYAEIAYVARVLEGTEREERDGIVGFWEPCAQGRIWRKAEKFRDCIYIPS